MGARVLEQELIAHRKMELQRSSDSRISACSCVQRKRLALLQTYHFSDQDAMQIMHMVYVNKYYFINYDLTGYRLRINGYGNITAVPHRQVTE